MAKVRELLNAKSTKAVHTIGPEALVVDAIKIFCENNIDSLIVLEQGVPVGFVDERDLLMRALQSNLRDLGTSIVRGVMTQQAVIAMLDDEISDLSEIMNINKIKHLPVLHECAVVGLLSLGDVVDTQISDGKLENKMLHDYIDGTYPG